jgi:UDP-N-acetylmuramate: L-alanyl-gamma-D-glutamyl-meso-diaminopimelate ligase
MHIHILGICGTFMGGLAALARQGGHTVTGCDAGVYPPMSDQLRGLGIELMDGYGIEQLNLKPDLFVVGNVVSRQKNTAGLAKYPLMEAILDQGLPYTSGPQWLSEHILHTAENPFHVLAIAGTHGKTTTASMLAWILEFAKLSPGYLIGGVPLNFESSARLPTSSHAKASKLQTLQQPLFVIEADEYDTAFFDKRSKFVHYRPKTCVLNNLEFDHADIFENLQAIEKQFHHLLRTVPQSGRVIFNAHEESIKRVLSMGLWSECESFASQSFAPLSDWTLKGAPESFEVLHKGLSVGQLTWTVQGVHNQMNALASIAAAHHVGVSAELSIQALTHFQNVRRRMELKAQVMLAGQPSTTPVNVFDDFAHHPTAIKTTLEGLRRQVGNTARILCVFEPRSNTMKLGSMKALLPDSLASADLSFCYTQGLDWEAQEALSALGDKAFCSSDLNELVARVASHAQASDQIICMSNGGFGGIHQKLTDALKAKV